MSFKTKINPSELSQMTQKAYEKLIKKEVVKAQKFGSVPIMVFSDFEFGCGTVATLMLLGKQSGELTKFYKKAKLERKKENDFAKGVCYFEVVEGQPTRLHIALNEGKGKPAKMTKNGKALFKKMGLSPNIYKGELPTELLENVETNLSQEELTEIDQTADDANDTQALGLVAKQYKKAYKRVSLELLPIIQEKAWGSLQPEHLAIATAGYRAASSFLDKYEESNDKKQEWFAPIMEQVTSNKPKLAKIAAKIKQELSKQAQVHGNADDMATVLADVKNTLAEMKPKVAEALAWLDTKIANAAN